MRLLIVILGVLLVSVAYRLFVSEDGLREVRRLEAEVAAQRDENAEFERRNASLAAEVEDLEQGTAAVEERARDDLGMVRDDETFYQVVDDAPQGTRSADRPQ